MTNVTGGTLVDTSQLPRSARRSPGSIPARRASARFTAISGIPSAPAGRGSRPRTSVQGGCPMTSAPKRFTRNPEPAGPPSASPTSTGTTPPTSGRAAIDAPTRRACSMRGPLGGMASVAVTRTSKPVPSRRRCIDTTSPRESMSMSKSSAPVAAMPATPSRARPDCRERLRTANRRALIAVRDPARCGAAAPRKPRRWPPRRAERQWRPSAARWLA